MFAFSVQDTIPPVERDTIPPVVPDTILVPVSLDTIPEVAPGDTIPETSRPDTTSLEEEPEELMRVEIWKYQFAENFDEAESDSSLRWINMVNLFNRFEQERGAITYRMGTVGRMDAMDLHGYETRHLNLELEGMNLNSPLTGEANWNRLPIQKIHQFREADFGATYRSQTRLKDYYLTQPRTYLNFDESKFNYRGLDFVFTQNIREDTNIELSFWDRRDGGGYNRSSVEGRQAAAMVYRQLSDSWMLKGAYINNAMDREESFGYITSDPQFFAFNRFIEVPNRNGANSNQTSSDVYIQTHYRSSVNSDVSSEFGLHYQTDKWALSYAADTLATNFRKTELFARQNLNLVKTGITATGRLIYLNEAERENLTENNWFGLQGEVDFTQYITNWIRVNAFANIDTWNDSRSTTELSGRFQIMPFGRTELSVFGGVLSRAPDIQSYYWRSADFVGSSALQNEETLTLGAEAKIGLGNMFTLGFRGDMRETEQAVFVDTTNTFINIDPYSQISGTGWVELDSQHFEGEVSATYKRYFSESDNYVNQMLDTSGYRTWIKGHLYWKSYLFDRATFVTAGFSGVMSPNAFRTAEFLTPLNRWQHGTNMNRFQTGTNPGGTDQFMNPSYYQVDLDVSARIRWFMLLLKWENIFDRVNQLGYFETTGYPMPERRFILGLRILFTN